MPSIRAELKMEGRSVHAAATEFARSPVRMRRLVRKTAVVPEAVQPRIDVTATDVSSLHDVRCGRFILERLDRCESATVSETIHFLNEARLDIV